MQGNKLGLAFAEGGKMTARFKKICSLPFYRKK
jgi:hypothetical protein